MILDVATFVAERRPHWTRLEKLLDRIAETPGPALDLGGVRELHALYERASADLARLATFSSEPETRRYLETLVARAYAEAHEARRRTRLPGPGALAAAVPRAFRRHLAAFWLALGIMLAGSAFGGLALTLDPEAREVLLPFSHLQQAPAERVAREESANGDRLRGEKATFSAALMTHNARVSLFALALGVTWGLGTGALLFGNGILLGAVAVDYVAAGKTAFLLGWLLPHGAVEIPAILLAGQAGLSLAGALIGRGDDDPRSARLRRVTGDVMTLAFGVLALLVWAGFVEAFLSQTHEPVVPYALKIAFGLVELSLLGLFLAAGGKRPQGEGD